MKKNELLKALRDCQSVYVAMPSSTNKEDWDYVKMDKQAMIQAIKNNENREYLVEVSAAGFYVWFELY